MRWFIPSVFVLPCAVLAAPTPEASVPLSVEIAGRDVSPAPRSSRLMSRSNQLCKIINTDYFAHCRSGPGTNNDITYYVFTNTDYEFECYDTGTCVDDNCTWDKLTWQDGSCWVSGFLTDDRCTVSRLGAC